MADFLIIGKRGGILHWFEDLLAAGGPHTVGFPLNHHNLTTQIAGHCMGKTHPLVRGLVHRGLMRALTDHRPQCILVVDLFYLEPQVNATLANYRSGHPNVTISQWIGDRFEDRLAGNTAVQHFYFTDSGLLQDAARLGLSGRYLPLAANPPRCPLTEWSDRDDAILFVGAPTQNRVRLVEQIKHPMRVMGARWPELNNPNVRLTSRRVSIAEVRMAYARHKYVLNAINPANATVGLPARCFDAAMHGALLLTEFTDDLPANFDIGSEVFAFASAGELNARLSGMASAEQMAVRGRLRAERDHSWKSRLAAIIADSRAEPDQSAKSRHGARVVSLEAAGEKGI